MANEPPGGDPRRTDTTVGTPQAGCSTVTSTQKTLAVSLIPHNLQASCLPRSANSNLLCPVRLEQSVQAPAMATRCASRLSKGASLRMSKMFCSIHVCRLRTGSRMRLALVAGGRPVLAEASLEAFLLLVQRQLRQQESVADANLFA